MLKKYFGHFLKRSSLCSENNKCFSHNISDICRSMPRCFKLQNHRCMKNSEKKHFGHFQKGLNFAQKFRKTSCITFRTFVDSCPDTLTYRIIEAWKNGEKTFRTFKKRSSICSENYKCFSQTFRTFVDPCPDVLNYRIIDALKIAKKTFWKFSKRS